MRPLLLVLLLALVPVAAQASSDVYPFESAAEQERFRTLISELRCPKCQNQNIADSNAPIAKDMRDEVYRMMQQGASNDQVTDALVSRFGEFVRYKPEFDQRTALLWVTPLIAVLGGLMVVAGIIIRSRRHADDPVGLTEEERRKAEDILRGSDSER